MALRVGQRQRPVVRGDVVHLAVGVVAQHLGGDRRELRGVVGEGVAWGEVWQAGNKTGFFRAFRVPPPAPGEAAAAPSGGAPTP